MASLSVVERFDVVGHGERELDHGAPALSIKQLDLHRAPERLHGSVVVAIADGAHRGDDPQFVELLSEGPRRELTAVVGVQDGTRWDRSRAGGHSDRRLDQKGVGVAVDRPPDHSAREHVEHTAAIHLAFASGVLGDVGEPELVGSGGVKGALDEILGCGQIDQVLLALLRSR